MRGTLPSSGEVRSKSPRSLAKRSTEVRMCWRPYKQPYTSLSLKPPKDFKRAIEGRIQALANVHSLFVKSRWIGAELSTIAKQELTPYTQNNESRVSIDGPEVLLEPNSAQAIAVTLHELATNAAKYGALSATQGQIEVKWSHTADGRLILLWTETGGPPVKTPTRQGFGGKVIEGMIEQLKGQTRFDWHPEGLVCEITLQA